MAQEKRRKVATSGQNTSIEIKLEPGSRLEGVSLHVIATDITNVANCLAEVLIEDQNEGGGHKLAYGYLWRGEVGGVVNWSGSMPIPKDGTFVCKGNLRNESGDNFSVELVTEDDT